MKAHTHTDTLGMEYRRFQRECVGLFGVCRFRFRCFVVTPLLLLLLLLPVAQKMHTHKEASKQARTYG